MKKFFTIIFLLFCFNTSHMIYAAEQAIQDLRAIVTQTTEISNDPSNQEQLYLNYIRILLDPAYLDLPVADRKTIDTMEDQFKQLHVKIAENFIPILPHENIETLKQLVSQAIKTIHSTKVGKIGEETFKTHVQVIIASLMSISPKQKSVEDQIKFQWIKPLYIDNQFLTTEWKKKLFDIFYNENYQKWHNRTKKLTLKTAPAQGVSAAESASTESTEQSITPPSAPSTAQEPTKDTIK